ncbi:glycoside hydrolase family 32 protein [Neisseria perflava]|nr:glycoside hydrolase family 32 protein [Neisseria perflava]
MHWGHSVSQDLIRWQELPVALEPDALGYIYSGSAITDKDNLSGLFADEMPSEQRSLLFYTNHLNENAAGQPEEMQSIAAVQTDGSYRKYAGNPIIPSGGRRDFRDPKVFYFEAGKTWMMTCSAGDRVEFYRSQNLLDWQKCGEFRYKFAYPHIWECPELLQVDGKWLLLASMIHTEKRIDSESVYFVGSFDGETFTPEQDYGLIDYGKDYYAAQSWYGVEPPTTGAWLSNWAYAQETPCGEYRGVMAVPRELSLEDNHLVQRYPAAFQTYLGERQPLPQQGELPQNVYLQLHADGNFSVELFRDGQGSFTLDYRQGRLKVTRGAFGGNGFHADFPCETLIDCVVETVDILLDYQVLEILINGGRYALTYQVYPQNYGFALAGNIGGEQVALKA